MLGRAVYSLSHFEQFMIGFCFLSQELKIKIDQACTAGDEFYKLYYENYDKKRHVSCLVAYILTTNQFSTREFNFHLFTNITQYFKVKISLLLMEEFFKHYCSDP